MADGIRKKRNGSLFWRVRVRVEDAGLILSFLEAFPAARSWRGRRRRGSVLRWTVIVMERGHKKGRRRGV